MGIFLKIRHAGSHIKDNKERTSELPITEAAVPGLLFFPLSMHIGAAAEPVVKIGQKVKVGTILARASGNISANVHSSVSGDVISIEKKQTLNGKLDCVIVKNNGLDEKEEYIYPLDKDVNAAEVLEAIRDAGIVGMGGAAFPTAVKMGPPEGTVIDTIIVNGAECEPYSTSDHRIMLEYPDEIVGGINEVKKLFPQVVQVIIGIEDNKPDAIKRLKEATKKCKDMYVQPLRSIYPQGSEKILIKKVTGREIPTGALPSDVRCVLMNVSTTRAIYRAVKLGESLYQRVVTVSGTPISNPKNLLVRIGTPVSSLIEDCGGFKHLPAKVLGGGPMMGRTIMDLNLPVIKGMTAITVLTKKEAEIGETSDCIRCSNCLNSCPMNLQPVLISEALLKAEHWKTKKLGAMDCVECGNCSYGCPARIPLLENIRTAKVAIKRKAGR